MTTTISTMRSTTREALGAPHQKMQYTFDQPEYTMADRAAANTRKHRRQHRKYSEDSDPTDGSGSLTYSAASSINSAAESTDSSFADIMRVLDMQDPQQNKGMTPAEYHKYLQRAHLAPQPHKQRSQTSVASSLQYSTDGESHLLHGTDLVPSITGSMGYVFRPIILCLILFILMMLRWGRDLFSHIALLALASSFQSTQRRHGRRWWKIQWSVFG